MAKKQKEACGFRFDHDPATLTPRGRKCKSVAVEELLWRDGRTSVACAEHGAEALTVEARKLLVRVRPLGR